jgi:hypothetical protein
MSTLIKNIININDEGVSFELTEAAALNGHLKARHWFCQNIEELLDGK